MKLFLDLGCREGDATAAFIGDPPGQPLAQFFRPRSDAHEFQIIGFESPLYRGNEATRKRFEQFPRFTLIEKLAWTYDGLIEFLTDGERHDSRIKFSKILDPTAEEFRGQLVKVPCFDLARFLSYDTAQYGDIVCKMDIEGAEYMILERLISSGALERLSELYVEYHPYGQAYKRPAIEAAIAEHVTRRKLYYRNDWP
jgi:FkbM family methyltransferase